MNENLSFAQAMNRVHDQLATRPGQNYGQCQSNSYVSQLNMGVAQNQWAQLQASATSTITIASA